MSLLEEDCNLKIRKLQRALENQQTLIMQLSNDFLKLQDKFLLLRIREGELEKNE